jgi:hypothetical protein
MALIEQCAEMNLDGSYGLEVASDFRGVEYCGRQLLPIFCLVVEPQIPRHKDSNRR